jgi:hypothetical protein
MADIRHTMSLDDSRFVQGLRHAEGAARGSSTSMETGFQRLGSSLERNVGRFMRFNMAAMAGRAVWNQAKQSLEEYGKEFDFAGDQVHDFEKRWKQSFEGMNREVFMLMQGMNSPDSKLFGVVSALDSAAVAVSRALTNMMGGQGSWEEAHKLMLEVEAMDKRNRALQQYGQILGGVQHDLATSTGRLFDAQRMVEDQHHAGQLKTIAGIGLPGDSAEMKKIAALEEERHRAALAAINEKEGKEKAADDRARESSRHQFTSDREGLRLQQMRLNGLGEEADLEEMKLEMEERAQKIQQSEVLTPDEKQKALDDLWNAQIGLEAGMKRKQLAQRNTIGFSGTDVSDTRVRDMILGPGAASRGRDDVAKNTRDQVGESKKHTSLLGSIDRRLAWRGGAVFG